MNSAEKKPPRPSLCGRYISLRQRSDRRREDEKVSTDQNTALDSRVKLNTVDRKAGDLCGRRDITYCFHSQRYYPELVRTCLSSFAHEGMHTIDREHY